MHNHGFSLVELMVTIAVIAILAAMAVPSFEDFRERALMRSTLNGLADVVELARFESVQRDLPVTVSFNRTDDTTWCAGAIEGGSACNCFETDPDAEDFCAIAQYPHLTDGSDGEAQAAALLAGVRMTQAPDFNGEDELTFDPKLGILADPARTGSVLLASPQASDRYRGRLLVSPLGRTRACSDTHDDRNITGLETCP
jgi:prepilin-type N-terminal cleavage/methylation domain-containing protein